MINEEGVSIGHTRRKNFGKYLVVQQREGLTPQYGTRSRIVVRRQLGSRVLLPQPKMLPKLVAFNWGRTWRLPDQSWKPPALIRQS